MKVKFSEYNGALTVSVFGLSLRQELVISGELGGFSFEVRDREEPIEAKLLSQDELRRAYGSVEDDDMFLKLAELRRDIANADGVPPYVVFHDKTLREMVDKRPADMASLGGIVGVGQAKLNKYGERFLSVLNGAAA